MNLANLAFYCAGAIALIASVLVITRCNAVHALLYLIVSLLALAVDFYLLGAPFVAALEVIIYAGAIMVLFVFVIMMLNIGPQAEKQERALFSPGIWFGPAALTALLLLELIWIVLAGLPDMAERRVVASAEVGEALYGPYLLGVEMASLLLLAGLVGAFHLGRRYFKSADIKEDAA